MFISYDSFDIFVSFCTMTLQLTNALLVEKRFVLYTFVQIFRLYIYARPISNNSRSYTLGGNVMLNSGHSSQGYFVLCQLIEVFTQIWIPTANISSV